MPDNSNTTYNNLTFRYMVDQFKLIADNHHILQSFQNGPLDEVDVSKLGLNNYPFLYIEPLSTDIGDSTTTYAFNVLICDVIREDLADRDDVYSSLLMCMKDVIANYHQNLYSTSWVNGRVELQLPINLEPFTARFDNMLTGWQGTFSIECNNINSLCDVPQIDNT